MTTNASQEAANALIAELIELGVQDFVVCPGSRSQALALALAEAERAELIRLHVRVDERSAAFFALGIARESGVFAPIVVTSGTAVANLLPAVMEAHYSRQPMLVLSADRPHAMRGLRNNQTVHDVSYTREFVRGFREFEAAPVGGGAGVDGDVAGRGAAGVVDAAGVQGAGSLVNAEGASGVGSSRGAGSSSGVGGSDVSDGAGGDNLDALRAVARELFLLSHGDAAGPSHLNISFSEPLSGSVAGAFDDVRTGGDTGGVFGNRAVADSLVYEHGAGAPKSVVVAGDQAGEAASDFAYAARLPLFAEPSSGARFGRAAVQHYETLLHDSGLAHEIERVIVFGHPTLTRAVPELLKRVETVVIDQAFGTVLDTYNPHGTLKNFANEAALSPDFVADPSWLGSWIKLDRELREAHTTVHAPDIEKATATGYKERSSYAREEVARLRAPVTREHLSETVWLSTWPHDRLMVASSRLVRVLNRQAAPRNIRVYANRGLAGIDGNIATALGIAVASQTNANPTLAAGVTRLLTGDLAFLHDVGSLALQEAEMRPRIQVIIGNDNGGSIFSQLEVRASADPEAFKRVMLTPQSVGIAALAEAYGWKHTLVSNQGELEEAMKLQVQGPEILEVLL